jgi:hypothetical protein
MLLGRVIEILYVASGAEGLLPLWDVYLFREGSKTRSAL